MFPELNREESQRYLEEMKASLRTKSGPSPYSRESSIQPYNSTAMHNSRESSVHPYNSPPLQHQPPLSVTSGQWQSSYSSQPHFSSPYGNLPSTAGVLPRDNFGQPPLNSCYGSTDGFLPRVGSNQPQLSSSYGNYSSTGYGHYGSYGGYDQSTRSFESGISTPGFAPATAPYPSYGVRASYRDLDVGSRNFVGMDATKPYQRGMVEPYPGTTTYAYDSHVGHTRVLGGPRADPPSPGEPPILPAPAIYGSSYGTRAPRPTHGKMHMQHHGGYVQPRPGYY
ncbi:hypothetical protein RJ639_009832 [Escallonia herrerae]|uniref:Uncharacterized protein n=1 Tax=Escallonia herrerae TaxID=1293975 RepID=A0AA88VVZ5_9ASTE|nr:hypothetical protein RJ639_009832 [Escallonia herrerae]